jgi:hypothetical protein
MWDFYRRRSHALASHCPKVGKTLQPTCIDEVLLGTEDGDAGTADGVMLLVSVVRILLIRTSGLR